MSDTLGLKELAKATGLSMSTISRALSGSPLVNERTRQRIMAVATVGTMQGKKLRPRYANLNSKSLALIQPSLAETDGNTEVSIHILEAMQDVAEKHNRNVIAGRLRGQGPFDDTMAQLHGSISGAVGFRLLDEHIPIFLNRVRSMQIPFVLLNRTEDDPSIPTCTVDHVLAGRLATSHLLDLGHRRIAILSNHSHIQSNRLRQRGIQQVFDERRIPTPASMAHADLNSIPLLREALHTVIKKHHATAVITSCDRMGLSVLRLLNEMGLSCPRDLSIVGFDGTQAAAEYHPSLTSVQIPWAKMAKGAARLLIWLGEDPQLSEVHLSWEPVLQERDSTAAIIKPSASTA